MRNIYYPCLILLQLVCTLAAASELKLEQRYTQYIWQKPVVIEQYKVVTREARGRGPASAVPSDDMESLPLEEKIWLSNVFVEDSSGAMNGMRTQLEAWDRREEYRRNWDIGSTGLYETPDRAGKKAWFNRMLLRYADKRLSGELKNAEEGSTMQRMRTVKQALRPNTEAQISNNIKLKFKARVLRLSAIMRVINPWVESETTFNVRGEVNSRLAKNFKDLGIRTEVNYQVTDGVYNAQISKPLSQNVTAVLSSAQSDSEVAFADMDRNTVQLIYSTPF